MKTLQRLVVMVLLGVWFFPALSEAKPLPTPSTEVAPRPPAPAAPTNLSTAVEAAVLAAREQQSAKLADFRGGGVEIYVGSGAMLVVVIVLLVLLV